MMMILLKRFSRSYGLFFLCLSLALPVYAGRRSTTLSFLPRGGETTDTTSTTSTTAEQEPASLDEKVHAAMKKLGLDPPQGDEGKEECKDGICSMPESNTVSESETKDIDPHEEADAIAKEMNVDSSLAMAALGATAKSTGSDKLAKQYDPQAARAMIQYELDAIGKIGDETPQVQQLVSEGFDPFMAKRALAFAEMSIEDARAILVAEQEDEEEEEGKQNSVPAKESQETGFKTVTVNSDFDPSNVGTTSEPPKSSAPPSPAKKEDVVFEATAADIHKVVLESPVPVLLDIYADWCGPCKALGPALEEMAIKSGGLFRLVKVNSDNERVVSGALEVSALPTVFGLRDGKIINMFQGMPRSQDAMQNFMSGLLIPGEEKNFKPPLTEEQREKYSQLTNALIKVAGAASFPFSARERLQEMISLRLDKLAEEASDFEEAEASAKVVRSLLLNVIRDPYNEKFRKVNLENKVIAAKVGKFQSSVALLKTCGFASMDEGKSMVLGPNKKLVNVAPLSIARDSIDKWIEKSRYEVAAAARKRRDLEQKAMVQEKLKEMQEQAEEDDDEEEEVDPNLCTLKLRINGKKKVKEVTMDADKPLKKILKKLKIKLEEGEEARITCAAKKLVVKSSDKAAMKKSLRDYGLLPSSSLVVKVLGDEKTQATSKLSERAASRKKKKGGSHTMQSIGLYSTQDNAKSELIDGGGGVWYEHDVTESEDEGEDASKVADVEDAAENEEAEDDEYDVEEKDEL